MAIGGFVEGPAAAGADYGGRVTSFVVLSCIVAGSGGILFGYDLGISGGVTLMESFLRKFFPDVYHQMKGDKDVSNYCRFDSELLNVFTSSLYVAGLVATLFASSVTRRFGRRTSILIGGTVFIVGSVFGGAAVNVYMLLLNRILLGIGLGFTNQEALKPVAARMQSRPPAARMQSASSWPQCFFAELGVRRHGRGGSSVIMVPSIDGGGIGSLVSSTIIANVSHHLKFGV